MLVFNYQFRNLDESLKKSRESRRKFFERKTFSIMKEFCYFIIWSSSLLNWIWKRCLANNYLYITLLHKYMYYWNCKKYESNYMTLNYEMHESIQQHFVSSCIKNCCLNSFIFFPSWRNDHLCMGQKIARYLHAIDML